MNAKDNLTAFLTLLRKEIDRITRIWPQTLLPPVITMSLYFVIFGNLIGSRIGQMDGFSYIEYIVPGLIMMSVVTNSYANVVSSFFGAKFGKHIEELIVSPMPAYLILLGYMAGGCFRGLLVGLIVTGVSMFFTDLQVHNLGITFSVLLLTSMLFSLGGFVNATFANKFDDISIVPTFILTPLTYLGGVFYSIKMLPDFWQTVSHFNPMLYIVNAFRFGILGVSDINAYLALSLIALLTVLMFCLCLWMLNRGIGIRS
ncbi:ABC transporter permease [Pelagibaculum spongiae]|uniref:Transport permease protein n=1 Tax=Pelagibaculum spongiae TaxID=2080658 RepID=A0A2V1GVV8_9GAMM|nr:ABC transporter permease [Pelagibaculum spongiae]PVZ70458.1 ABC transporter permease [Pelagibaculum spongiae]